MRAWALSLFLALHAIAQPAFDRGQSAALFVGVQQFTRDDSVTEVRYAVDDAIDLAYVLSLDPRVSLVTPRSVALALSGSALKPESRQRLTKLIDAGATVAPATQDDVLALLRRQADRAGRNGILIVSIASHGFSSQGTPYVLTATSLAQQPETSLAASTVLDIASASRAARSLIFLDACRERKNAGATPASEGQAVLFSAPPGRYAYDDDERQNGVFTSAVIDALQCRADADVQGRVTAETLSRSVEERVRAWHHDLPPGRAIQQMMDRGARSMPLAMCGRPSP